MQEYRELQRTPTKQRLTRKKKHFQSEFLRQKSSALKNG